MSNENETKNETKNVDKLDKTDSLIAQVKGELKKAEADGVKAKLKEIFRKRGELEKSMRLLDLESAKLIEDFNSGIL